MEGGEGAVEEEERGTEEFCSPRDEQSCKRKTVHSSSLRDCSFSTGGEERRNSQPQGRLGPMTIHFIYISAGY